MTIGGIRQLPDVQREVLELMTKLQGMIPSLAKDPSSLSGQGAHQPAGVFTDRGEGVEQHDGMRYVYVSSLGKAIPVVNTPADLSNVRFSKDDQLCSDSDSEGECSADEDCFLSPEPGQRFSWKRNLDGSKYFVPVPDRRAVSPGLRWKYVLDKVSGRYEKRQVTAEQPDTKSVKPKSRQSKAKEITVSPSPRYRDHRVPPAHTGSAGRAGQSQCRRVERQPTYVCPDVQSERQGKEAKIPDLVHYARECPVSWTSKVTTEGMNPVLWSWAYVSQLLATRTGQAPELSVGELEASSVSS